MYPLSNFNCISCEYDGHVQFYIQMMKVSMNIKLPYQRFLCDLLDVIKRYQTRYDVMTSYDEKKWLVVIYDKKKKMTYHIPINVVNMRTSSIVIEDYFN